MRSSPSTARRSSPCRKASGFDLSAYLVPILAILARRRRARLQRRALAPRRRRSRSDEDAAPAAPQGEDAERLEADLSRYDL